MRSIVTGGAGFIGSNLCEELVRKGHDVYSIDDYSSGYERNLKGLDVTAINCDVSDYRDMLNVFNRIGKIDYIFHQAASKKNICLRDPVRDMEVNIRGTYNVAQLAILFDAKMVHASTGSVYGESVGLQDEMHPLNPVSYYGVSKLAGEKYVAMLGTKGLRSATLRYFHVYGPKQEDNDHLGGVVAIWIKRIEEGKELVLFGDGTQRRSFTYVGDVVKANILAAENGSGVYNCVSGYMYSLNDLVETLENQYVTKFKLVKEDWMEGDIKNFNVDNTRIKEIGMKEWVELKTGLYLMT